MTPSSRSPRLPPVIAARPGRLNAASSPALASERRAACIVLALTALAGAARVRGLTRLSLWRDDAWVGLSATTGPRTAVRMSATTPGFTLVERAWLQLGPAQAPWWGQLLPLALAVAAVPAVYLVLRAYRLPIGTALTGAALVMASPVATTYATRLKPYGLDLLGACLLLWLAERVRRSPTNPALAQLAAASVLLLVLSGSTAPAIAGAWAATILGAVSRPAPSKRLIGWGAMALAGGCSVYLVFFRGLPPGLSTTWHDYYLDPSSWAELRGTVGKAAPRLLGGLIPIDFEGRALLATAVLGGALVLGLASGRRAWAPAGTILAAVVAAALEISPIGTGRVDEVLYPALILLFGLALGAMATWARRASGDVRALLTLQRAGLLVLCLLLAWSSATRRVTYPAIDLARLRQIADEHRVAGDVLVIDARTRYAWALAHPSDANIEFGDQWLTGFTTSSTEPGVFVQKSYSVEHGHTPLLWAQALDHATQLLYLSTPFENADGPPDAAYDVLLTRGWHPTQAFDVTGGRLVILRR